jgi:Zn-dependent protease with chaperone function
MARMNNRSKKKRVNAALVPFFALTLLAVLIASVLSGRSPGALLALIVTVCQRSLNETLAHGADLSNIFLLIPLGIGTMLATGEAVQIMLVTRQWTTSLVPLDCAPDEKLRHLAHKCGLPQVPILLCCNHTIVFTHGLFRPRVWLSSGLLRELDDDELEAVLRHEAYHLRARDPLKILVVRFLKRTLFFVPLARDLFDAYWVEKEIAADRQTIDAMGDTAPLVRALRKLTVARPAPHPKMALVSEFSAMETRLLALLHPNRRFPLFPLRRLSLNSLWLIVFMTVVLLPLPGHMPSLTECVTTTAFQSGVFLGLPGF